MESEYLKVLDAPIIKLFTHNNNYYLYDTYTNYLLSVSKDHYKELNRVMKIGLSEYLEIPKHDSIQNDVKLLIQKGMLKANFVDKIEHPLVPFVSSLVDSCLNEMIIQVTQNCNFNCRYCSFATDNGFDRIHNEVSMTWEIAQKAINYLYEHSYNSSEITIYFYGGEPLLKFPLIKKIVAYSEKLFSIKKVKFSMTSNGSLLSEEMMNFFIEHDFHIALSFDGNKEIQNKHRKFGASGNGTFDVVNKNVKRFQSKNKKYFDTQISVMPVVFDDENYDDVRKFFLSMGIKNITPLNANLRGIDYKMDVMYNQKSKVIENYESVNGINDTSNDLEDSYTDKTRIYSSWHHNGPCIAGVHRLFVDVYGDFYPCEKVSENKVLSIGNVEDGIETKKVIDFLNIGTLSEKNCKSCWAMRFCNLCIDQCIDYEFGKLSQKVKETYCNMQKNKALAFLKKRINDNQSS